MRGFRLTANDAYEKTPRRWRSSAAWSAA